MSYTLDEAVAAFISGPTAAIAVASRDAHNVPSLFRAAACRVSKDRALVTLFVDQQAGAAVVRDLRAGHPVAAVFSEPATHRTIQLKGGHAEVGPVMPADREYARMRYEEIVAHIVGLGLSDAGTRCFFHFAPVHLVGISFQPTAAFEQTPGPRAGARLGR
jgi:hypothetical protein